MLLFLIQLALAVQNPAYSVDRKVAARKPASSTSTPNQETQARAVDEAALYSQQMAGQKLHVLMKRYHGTAQESAYLQRLAELNAQNAQIYFRLAQGTDSAAKRKSFHTKHQQSLRDTIGNLDRLISAFPHFPDMHQALFLRGKSYEDLEKRAAAKQDYLTLVNRYPLVPESMSAWMSLASFAIDENHHEEALKYLREIEKDPTDPHYPFALYKMAWAHYNLKHSGVALKYLERHIAYYRKGSSSDRPVAGSDQALIDNSLQDLALFYLQGFENKESDFTIGRVYGYLKSQESGPTLGKMLLRFAKLLRSHNFQEDLRQWTRSIIPLEYNRPEMFEVATVVLEEELNRKNFAGAAQSAQDFVEIYKKNPRRVSSFDSYRKAQRLLLDTTQMLQALIIKNKKNATPKDLEVFTGPLSQIYSAFIKIVDERDPRIPAAHYNLAEVLFQIKDYEPATEHYRWTIEHWRESKAPVPLHDLRLKAIACRYEQLKGQRLIPDKLQSHAYEMKSELKDKSAKLEEWIQWVDEFDSLYGLKDPEFHEFLFEANRSMYAFGSTPDAIKRLMRFSKDAPQSKPAVPSASLALDTAIHSKNWKMAFELASQLLEVPESKGFSASFRARLTTVATDSYTQWVETLYKADRTEDFEPIPSMAWRFENLFPNHTRMEDVYLWAARASEKLGKDLQAIEFASRLLSRFPESENAPATLLLRAKLFENRVQLGLAAPDFERYLQRVLKKANTISSDTAFELRKKVLYYTWIFGSPAELKRVASSAPTCPGPIPDTEGTELENECAKYQLAAALLTPESAKSSKQTWTRAMKGHKEHRAGWAALRLEDADSLPFPDRLALIRSLATHWDKLDAKLQLATLPLISRSIERTFQLNRLTLSRLAKLNSTESSIQHRVQLVQEVEAVATLAAKRLPWIRIRSAVLAEVAKLYIDFSRELSAMRAPGSLPEEEKRLYMESVKKLTIPFEEKGQELLRRAYELASASSIETVSLDSIEKPFFADNPSQAQALQGAYRVRQTTPVDLELLTALDPEVSWLKLKLPAPARETIRLSPLESRLAGVDPKGTRAEFYEMLWKRGVLEQHPALSAYALGELENQKLVPALRIQLLQGVALALLGAQSEALAKLEEVRGDLSKPTRARLNTVLICFAVHTLARERAKTLLEELESLTYPKSLLSAAKRDHEEYAISYGAEWSGAKLSVPEKERLRKAARWISSDNQAETSSYKGRDQGTGKNK